MQRVDQLLMITEFHFTDQENVLWQSTVYSANYFFAK